MWRRELHEILVAEYFVLMTGRDVWEGFPKIRCSPRICAFAVFALLQRR
jgi:hypothetical protein